MPTSTWRSARRRLAAVLATAALAAAAGCGGTGAQPDERSRARSGVASLAVVLPARDALALVDPGRGEVARIPVGASPWGVAVTRGRAYVSTARGVTVVDLARRRVVRRVSFRTRTGPIERGEYRAGGMGIAVSPDGRRVFVGVHAPDGGRGVLEAIDTRALRVVGSARVGIRPFDVLVTPDGRTVVSVDHDSYGVTLVDAATFAARFLRVAPLGDGAFDKLNYGAVDGRGRVLLPINGRVLAILDPGTGRVRTRPMRADVHQAGVTLSRGRLLTVGAESLVEGSPNLSVYELASRRERVLPLRRPHEDVAVSANGRTAHLTGGYTRGGWSGMTVVTLANGLTRELRLPAEPLGIATIPRPG